jgi:hypothetical protein
MLFGYSLPNVEQLYKIAEILEVCPLWLSGQTERRKAFSKDAILE